VDRDRAYDKDRREGISQSTSQDWQLPVLGRGWGCDKDRPNHVERALFENEKFSTRFFVPAQSPKGIRYCPYTAQFIVDIQRSCDNDCPLYSAGDSIERKPFSVEKGITPMPPQIGGQWH